MIGEGSFNAGSLNDIPSFQYKGQVFKKIERERGQDIFEKKRISFNSLS